MLLSVLEVYLGGFELLLFTHREVQSEIIKCVMTSQFSPTHGHGIKIIAQFSTVFAENSRTLIAVGRPNQVRPWGKLGAILLDLSWNKRLL